MTDKNKKLIIAGQLSTVHSSEEVLQVGKVDRYLDAIRNTVPLDILIMGWNEKPDLFKHLTHPDSRKSNQVFLWYPFLSDYPGMQNNHLVVNLDGEISQGWAGYAGTGINESFQQACPNNPLAISTSLRHLERFMNEYSFDGAFIDKIRFPSPANGFNELFTCFCDHCVAKAAQYDLDLGEVRFLLRNTKASIRSINLPFVLGDQTWLEGLLAEQPVLQRFINFRMDSINRLLLEIDNLLKSKKKILAIDVFSPSLAPLVGQDFGFMSTIAEWVKPMIYRFGHGPSSLRSEIPALIDGLSNYLALDTPEVTRFISAHINGLQNIPLEEIVKIAPLSLIQAETDLAVKQLTGTQVYLGLETVFIPHKMEIKPQDIEEIIKIGSNSGVNGYVLSWDLLHTPINNVVPLRALT